MHSVHRLIQLSDGARDQQVGTHDFAFSRLVHDSGFEVLGRHAQR